MMASGGVREGEKSEQEGKREGRGRGRPSEEESLLDAGLEAELDISVGCPGEDKDPSNDLPLLIMVEFDGYKGQIPRFYQRLHLFILGITATIANVLNSIWWWPTLLRFVSHCESQGMTLRTGGRNKHSKQGLSAGDHIDIEGYEQGRADVYSSLDSSAIDFSFINSSINF